MNIKKMGLYFFMLLIWGNVQSQTSPFSISIEPFKIPGLGGIQSFAFGRHDGKWLIVGGRLDGLHQRQPFASFDLAGHNNQIFVIDPVARQKWSAPLSSLTAGIREQLKSTNMEFYQQNNFLYLIGGYGYSETLGDHTTFENLTAIDVPSVMKAIIDGRDFTSFIRQIRDPLFQVAGGRLEKIEDVYHLVGGQKFIGRYNPMGPAHGPGFEQEYTNQIRKFKLMDNGTTITIDHLPGFTDEQQLHRRDYNVVPQILPDGQFGLTAFSGVFQKQVDLPFLNCVNIDATSYAVNDNFVQHYNHYHCANIPIFSAFGNEMHTIFFGGIAQFYDSSGILVQDNNVPFVKTVARVTRTADGSMAEYKLPVELPGLLGAGSEFIPLENLPRYENSVLKLDDFPNGVTHLGYIFGGISSAAANVFWINDGSQSVASSQLIKVNLIKNQSTATDELNRHSNGSLQLRVYPNPNNGFLNMHFQIIQNTDIQISLWTLDGRKLDEETKMNVGKGQHHIEKRFPDLMKQQAILLKFETSYERDTRVLLVGE
ncbi:MAG: T9SS C-terminal target domain-containing protein [Saprospiraceae bacterium]|nr:T9SS C-terminal target domain-containing protein [Saprospiraceae bacterium]